MSWFLKQIGLVIERNTVGWRRKITEKKARGAWNGHLYGDMAITSPRLGIQGEPMRKTKSLILAKKSLFCAKRVDLSLRGQLPRTSYVIDLGSSSSGLLIPVQGIFELYIDRCYRVRRGRNGLVSLLPS